MNIIEGYNTNDSWQSFNMNNITINNTRGYIFDSGGPTGNYGNYY